MTESNNLAGSEWAEVVAHQRTLARWLLEEALPRWDEHGVDRISGGFFEQLAFDERTREFAASGAVRRGRVVARQMYVFDVGHRGGWRSSLSDPVMHGCQYLFGRMHAHDGVFHTALEEGNHSPTGPFSLYEHAFYLFALARVNAAAGGRFPTAHTAQRSLARLRAAWGREQGGFEESQPPSLPLQSNPHMHLLEAALAWIETTEGAAQEPWIRLAGELVALCLRAFVDPDRGGIREYFDFDWRPMPGEAGRIVEPGHQFEWAWLLLRWSTLDHGSGEQRRACVEAAQRLVTVGERWGVDLERGVAVNALWDDMTVKDGAAKLWPQTERVKAWCAVFEQARDADEVRIACRHLALAADGLLKFLPAHPAGLWHEVLRQDGSFVAEPSKASSFYHVVCAIDVLGSTVARAEQAAGAGVRRTAFAIQ